MEIKILFIILGIIIGILVGMLGSTAGDHYCLGLSNSEEQYLCKRSLIYNIAYKLQWLLIFIGSPFLFMLLFFGYAIIGIFCPDFINYIDVNQKILLEYLILYLVSLLFTYFIGLYYGCHLQDKYLKHD